MNRLRACACTALCLALIGCASKTTTAPRATASGRVVVRAYTIDAEGVVTDSVDYASVSGIKVRLLSDTATISMADSAITVHGAFSFTHWTAGRYIAVGCVRGFPIDSTGPIQLGSTSSSFPSPLVFGTHGPIHVYPNPTSGADRLQFSLDSARTCRVLVTTMAGEIVRTLASQQFPSGVFSLAWDGLTDSSRALPPGIYWAVVDRRTGLVPSTRPASAVDVPDPIPVPGGSWTPPISCTVISKQ